MDYDNGDEGSTQKNSINTTRKVETTIDDIQLSSTNNRHKYPLTELSKREKAAKLRMERKREAERKDNEMIQKCGNQVTQNRLGKPRMNRIESLIRINDNRLYRENSDLVEYFSQGLNLEEKIKTLELNLKKLEIDLTEEKNRLAIVEEPRLMVNDRNDFVLFEENTIDNKIEKNDTVNEKDNSNMTNSIEKSTYCSLNKYVYETPKQEIRLTVSPENIEFRVNSNATQGVFKRYIKVTNRSKNTILCRYSHLFDPNSVLRDDINVIKVKPKTPCRLRPAMTVNYLVTFKPAVLLSTKTYQSLENVRLMFDCSNDRTDVKSVFHIPVNFHAVKPEPVVVTETITFPPVNDSNINIIRKKYLILKNNGDADCIFSVFKEAEYQTTRRDSEKNVFVVSSPPLGPSQDNLNDGSTRHTAALNRIANAAKKDKNIFEVIIGSVVRKMFTYFRWRNNTNVLLPAKGSVKVPVIFNQNFAYSTVSEYFVIAFDNTEHEIPNQRVNVIGHIKEQTLLVIPDVINVGLCYLMIPEQVIGFRVQNNSRVVMPYEIKLPNRGLSKHVKLSHSKGYLRANSSLEVSVRLRLKCDILWSDDCAMFFDADSGFLEFPIRVYSSNSKTWCEVRVLAVVTTPFGLILTPDRLDFGTVNTMETVVRSITMTNYSRTPMNYGFLDLPEMVSIYPTAFGTIFSGEIICLHVHYSPKIPKMFPRDVHMFEDDFILTCFTITGLNAEKMYSVVETTEQIYETATEEISTVNENNKSTTSISHTDELDHGPDKIQIQRPMNVVVVSSLNTNTILKEATIKCNARIHEIPVELSVQKIIFEKTPHTSFSTFNIDLSVKRASNLSSVSERSIKPLLDFKIRFEFVSNDPCVEFKPKNGILQSKDVIKICVILRPMFDYKLQNMYKKHLDYVSENIDVNQILKHGNHNLNLVDGPFAHDQIRLFEVNRIFYSTLTDETKIVSAVCFVQFINKKSIDYFGFDTGSLKLSVVCPTMKPNVILFAEQINFGRCTMNVRHEQLLIARNITERPVPLKISPPNPMGPFFCSFALNGESQLLSPGLTMPIKILFTPEHESTVNETLEVISETTRLTVKLSGRGLRPSCNITPDGLFNIIHTTHGNSDSKFIFQVTNISDIGFRLNVQLEWMKKRSDAMTDDEAYKFTEGLRQEDRSTAVSLFDGPDWTELIGDAAFDLGKNGSFLWFQLNPNDVRNVEVTFKPLDHPAENLVPMQDFLSFAVENAGSHETNLVSGGIIFWRHVYVAKINVHVGQSILHWFYVLGFVLMKTPTATFQSFPVDNNTYINTDDNVITAKNNKQ